jgi:hypothetical protein
VGAAQFVQNESALVDDQLVCGIEQCVAASPRLVENFDSVKVMTWVPAAAHVPEARSDYSFFFNRECQQASKGARFRRTYQSLIRRQVRQNGTKVPLQQFQRGLYSSSQFLRFFPEAMQLVYVLPELAQGRCIVHRSLGQLKAFRIGLAATQPSSSALVAITDPVDLPAGRRTGRPISRS